MPYLCTFVEEVVPLSGAITDKWVLTLVCGRNKNISNDQVNVAAKNISAKLFACEFGVKRYIWSGAVS